MTSYFWLILLAVLAYGLVHSLLASLRTKAQTRQLIGPAVDRWYRLGFNFIAVITLLPILLLPLLLSDKKIYTIPYPWVILSLIFQVLAIIALFIGLRQTGIFAFLGLSQAFLPGDITPPHFVTDGLYRYVRHPLYTAGLVLIWLLPVLTWNLLALNIGFTVYILIGAQIEERKLLREFGDSYAKYRSRTPMLIPSLVFPHRSQKS
jgi:protein-S-isoprenylcysteine O-methyltransferase Ste14